MNKPATTRQRVIMWGATGQAKVIRPILDSAGAELVALFDDTPGLISPFGNVPLYAGRRDFPQWIATQNPSDLGFIIAIGNPHGRVRMQLRDYLQGFGLHPFTVTHPTAWIEPGTVIGAGAQIMAGAIILAEVVLGEQCIVNTRASIDHESVLADGVEIAPAATLCGLVHCETNAWIGAGATVLPRMRIGADAVVGAGAVVRTDIAAGTTVVGVPARPVVRHQPDVPTPRIARTAGDRCHSDKVPVESLLTRTPE